MRESTKVKLIKCVFTIVGIHPLSHKTLYTYLTNVFLCDESSDNDDKTNDTNECENVDNQVPIIPPPPVTPRNAKVWR